MSLPNAADYQPGGTAYTSLANTYGEDAAQHAADLALNSSNNHDLNAYLSDLRRRVPNPGAPDLPDSTLDIFTDQIATDPLAAPLDAANTAAKNSFKALFKSPWFLLAIVVPGGIALFLYLGGLVWLKKRFAR